MMLRLQEDFRAGVNVTLEFVYSCQKYNEIAENSNLNNSGSPKCFDGRMNPQQHCRSIDAAWSMCILEEKTMLVGLLVSFFQHIASLMISVTIKIQIYISM